MATLLEARKVRVHLVEVVADALAECAARVGAREEVLFYRQVLEAVAAFPHLAKAALHELGGIEAIDALALVDDLAFSDVAALGAQQVRDGLQRGGLARAVGAEQRHDLPVLHLERDAAQHEDHVVEDDLDVREGEERWGGKKKRRPAARRFRERYPLTRLPS